METKNLYDKNKVVVLKIQESDIEGMIMNHDLNEEGIYSYMETPFIESVMNYLPEYAMGQDPIPTEPTRLIPYLREAAKSVVKIKKVAEIKKYLDAAVPYEEWDEKILKIYNTKGIFSELILHFLLREFKDTVALISKIYFKDSFAHEAHGFDAVHVSDDKKIWLGETKFYNNGKRGVDELIDDLNKHFNHNYLQEQFVIISRALVHNNELREEWIQKLNEATRLEDKFNMVIIPLLCIYEDKVAGEFLEAINNGTDADSVLVEHVSELKKYFEEKNNFKNKDNVQALLILLPVESKNRIVGEMLNRIYNMQNI
ncbi:MAG: DUF1837 domain-containing protein [Lachnospiraceae bacterium]